MEYLSHFILGVLATYIGLLAPGILNMTIVQIAIDRGVKRATAFSFGASIIVFAQAGIAMVCTNYLHKHDEIIERIESVGVFVFFVLAIVFFMKTRSKFKFRRKKQHENYILKGVLMSTMNMLAIPFYLGVSTFLVIKGLLLMGTSYITLFVVGALFGSYLLFFTYISFAKTIKKRSNFITQSINYFLSLIFIVLGLIIWLK